MTILLFGPLETLIYAKCTNLDTVDNKLIFNDCNGTKHVTTLPYELIYETV